MKIEANTNIIPEEYLEVLKESDERRVGDYSFGSWLYEDGIIRSYIWKEENGQTPFTCSYEFKDKPNVKFLLTDKEGRLHRILIEEGEEGGQKMTHKVGKNTGAWEDSDSPLPSVEDFSTSKEKEIAAHLAEVDAGREQLDFFASMVELGRIAASNDRDIMNEQEGLIGIFRTPGVIGIGTVVQD